MMKFMEDLRKAVDWVEANFRIRWWNLSFIYALVIIILQSMPDPPAPEVLITGSVWPDPVKHIILYLGFSLVLGITLRHSDVRTFRKHCYLWAIAFAVLFGIFDELYQLYIPGRTSDVFDVLADSAGAVTAQGLRWVIKLEKNILHKLF